MHITVIDQYDNRRTVEAAPNHSLLDTFRANGIELNSPCNGFGTCGKCRVTVDGSVHLACKTSPTDGACVHYTSSEGTTEHVTTTGRHETEPLGIAIDIGTTGISCALVGLHSHRRLSAVEAVNRQTRFGADVFTRIAHSMSGKSACNDLQETLTKQLDTLCRAAIGTQSPNAVEKIAIAANTTMCALLLGLDVTGLSRYPYTPPQLTFENTSPSDVGLSIFSKAQLTLLPCAGAFIGGDITAGLSVLPDIAHTALFVDIGTNGEIVLLKAGRRYATSTAAGPALEGMNISCGSRAIPGAIERVTRIGQDIAVKTIGDLPATSLCGSGLIDAVATLLDSAVLTPSGRYLPKFKDGYPLAEDIVLTQRDIRQVQLAKGAIASGIRALLRETGTAPNAVQTLYIAGNFGYHLTSSAIRRIGLVPEELPCAIEFLGNTALAGAVEQLYRRETLTAGAVDILELSTLDDFQTLFIDALNFPEERTC